MRSLPILAALAGVLSAAGGALALADPPYRSTGQWIVNGLFILILVLGAVTWWVVRRYTP